MFSFIILYNLTKIVIFCKTAPILRDKILLSTLLSLYLHYKSQTNYHQQHLIEPHREHYALRRCVFLCVSATSFVADKIMIYAYD